MIEGCWVAVVSVEGEVKPTTDRRGPETSTKVCFSLVLSRLFSHLLECNIRIPGRFWPQRGKEEEEENEGTATTSCGQAARSTVARSQGWTYLHLNQHSKSF